MSDSIPEDKAAAITDLISQGNKIQAIKLYRETMGVGLKEAKEEVEALEATLRARFPERFTGRSPTAPSSKGCAGSAAVLCLGAVLLVYRIVCV